MTEENVKVAVRVRPFNQREKDAKSELVVQMSGNQTMISKPKSTEEPKKYAYDFSYWSHDGFKTNSTGYFEPDGAKYADQKKVYNDLGAGVLKNAYEGYNASLFAYGQTGSGKSYSVVGYGANRGIVPMVCEEIFNKVESDKQSGIQYEVTFSMLEIYSEVVRDLLNPSSDKRAGLTIREDPKIGFYPQGLKKQLVSSYSDITKLMDQGTANRTIAATNMNATSSRAHTIVTVSLVQKYKNAAGKEMAKSSLINLVDLAGSERADATGATGDRLKEGAAINLSLTSLGNVIAALADNSSGKNVRVPYRDSVLTKLLMNALGGNSKTIMIAAISPAEINYDETLSTLRYADRAKQIKCKAAVNEDPTEKLIKSLQDENAKLKQLLASGGKLDSAQTGGISNNDELKKALEDNEKQMEAMKKSYEEKLAEAQSEVGDLEQAKILEKAKKFPHFSNINMDPSLTGKIKFILEGDGQKSIGVPKKSDIGLSGLGINDPHATVKIQGGKVTLDKVGQSKVLVNGRPIVSATELKHLDRLVFGTSQYFAFVDPAKKSDKDVFVTFEMAQDEIAKASGVVSKDTTNMSKDEIACQGELVDLIPAVDEANQMSISLDKKVKFEILVVSAEARGEYDGKVKPFVLVKNFATGYEWLWDKAKFLDRKDMMSLYYLDFKEDGDIDNEKFKTFDPFQESPDTPTQLGTAMVFAKSFAYLVANKGDYKITSLKGKPHGVISLEILPCDAKGNVLTDKSGIVIKNPQQDLLNKQVHFIIKINSVKGLDAQYEDIYCQFTLFNQPQVYKTDVVKGTNNPEFKYSKQFDVVVTADLLDNLLNKCLFIQIWGEQKHVKADPANMKISTKEYFDREKNISGEMNNVNSIKDKALDPEKQKLRDDLKVSEAKNKQLEAQLSNYRKLLVAAKASKTQIVPTPLLEELMQTNPDAADKLIQTYLAKIAQAQQQQASTQQAYPTQPGQPQNANQQGFFGVFTGVVDGAMMMVPGDYDDDIDDDGPNAFRRRPPGQNQSYACNVM